MGKGRTKVIHEPDCAVIQDIAAAVDEADDTPHVVPKCTCARARRRKPKRKLQRSKRGESCTAGMQDGVESLMHGNYRSFAGYYE